MRLPSSTATRSPGTRPSLAKPAASSADCAAASRQLKRRSPQMMASPSGLRAAVSAIIAQMLAGRSTKAGTTRSPKRASSRIGGMEECDDQSMRRSSGADDGDANHGGMESKGKGKIGDDADSDCD